jgi:hypothetical protein
LSILRDGPIPYGVVGQLSLRELTNFQVPLDYNNVNNTNVYGEKASIAIIRIPAKVGRDDPRYKGPILFNPGMPCSLLVHAQFAVM